MTQAKDKALKFLRDIKVIRDELDFSHNKSRLIIRPVAFERALDIALKEQAKTYEELLKQYRNNIRDLSRFETKRLKARDKEILNSIKRQKK